MVFLLKRLRISISDAELFIPMLGRRADYSTREVTTWKRTNRKYKYTMTTQRATCMVGDLWSDSIRYRNVWHMRWLLIPFTASLALIHILQTILSQMSGVWLNVTSKHENRSCTQLPQNEFIVIISLCQIALPKKIAFVPFPSSEIFFQRDSTDFNKEQNRKRYETL